MIKISLLGPPRVESDGTLVAFDTRKALALLAHLVLGDSARPRDALVELLWPESDPPLGRGALRRTLSSLRSAIGPEFLESTRDHVLLVPGPGLAVDVLEFRALRKSGRLEEAVDLFEGPFLEGFAVRGAPAFEEWAALEGERLRRELVSSLAELARLRQGSGDRNGAQAAVQRWLRLDPLHEPAHQALIRLYAESGDRAAALGQYRECVRTLSRELGVPPLPSTTQLYDQINQGTIAPEVPAAHSHLRVEPQPALSMVGRDRDLHSLRSVYQSIGSDGAVALVEGEAGIGKTRLAEEFLGPLRGRRATILAGRAYEDESGLAYAPLADALRARLSTGDDWLANVPRHDLDDASRLLPELRAHGAVPEGTQADDPAAETRFQSALWNLMCCACAGENPGVIYLDDAQWADESTRSLISYGLRRLTGRRLLVLLTWRTPYDHPLRRAATTLTPAGTSPIRLTRLKDSDVGQLAQEAGISTADPTSATRLWEQTEGVPLMVVEYLRAASGEGDWHLPVDRRQLLLARLAPLTETARQSLAAAAVLGRSFDADALQAVSGRTDEETVASIEELLSRGLLQEGDQEYDFAHGLTRALVYEDTSLARRRLLHARAAALPGAAAGVSARHLQAAGREQEAAYRYREAGDLARAVFANTEGLAHLQAALALGHPGVAELHVDIGDLQMLIGDYAAARASFESAASAGDGAALGGVEHRLGRLHHRRGEFALARLHLEAALAATRLGDAAARSRVLADLSLTAHLAGDDDLAQATAGTARSLAEEAGDLRARCQCHNLLGLLATATGDTAAALADLERSRDLADQLGDLELGAAARNNLALAYRASGRLGPAVELTVAALDLCVVTGDRHYEAALHNNLADLLHEWGQPDLAMEHLKTAVTLFAEVGAEQEPQPGIWKLVRW